MSTRALQGRALLWAGPRGPAPPPGRGLDGKKEGRTENKAEKRVRPGQPRQQQTPENWNGGREGSRSREQEAAGP